MNFSIKRDRFFSIFVITAMYIALFQNIILGVALELNTLMHYGLKGLIQFYIFIIPLVMVFFVQTCIKRFHLVILLFLYIFITQMFTEYASMHGAFIWYKTFLAALLYIPIIHHLMKAKTRFSLNFEKHFRNVLLLSGAIFFFEVISRYVPSRIYFWFLSLAEYQENAIPFSRPLGIGLDIHLQGILFAYAIVYFFINREFIKAYIFLFMLFLSGIKTWLIAIVFIGALFFAKILISGKVKKVVFLSFGAFALGFVCTILVFNAQVEHYVSQLSSASYVRNYMSALWFNSFSFMVESIFPQGMFADEHRLGYLSESVVKYNDIPVLFFGYLVGTFGMILYCWIVFYTLFKGSKYQIIVALSLFSFVHSYYLNNIGIFIIFSYFSYYFMVEKIRPTPLLIVKPADAKLNERQLP
ncbi:MAG: hypothetical protein IBX45_12495 [Campylobacterales bacterium]|nr:hypothetical protein [Campylobacterales bacterium]